MNFFAKPTPNETVFGFLYFALQLLVIPGILLAVNMILPSPLSEAAINIVFFAINFVAVLLIFHKLLRADWLVLRAYPWQVLRFAALGLVIYMVGNTLFGWLTLLLDPDFVNINDASIYLMVQDHYVLMTIGTVVLVPVAEECFYRALFFRTLYDKYPVVSYVVSMVIFSIAHVAAYVTLAEPFTLFLCFLQYLPAGFALAWSYRRSGSIFAPILIHMAVNQTGMLLMR